MKRILLVAMAAFVVAGCSKFDNSPAQKAEFPVFTHYCPVKIRTDYKKFNN